MFRLIVFQILMMVSHLVCAQIAVDTLAIGKIVWSYHRAETGLTEKGVFVNGKRHGVWQFHDSSGSLILREKYKKGAFIWGVYYRKGKVIASINSKGKITKRPDCGC